MAYPYTVYAGLTTTAGQAPDITRPDRTVAVNQPTVNHQVGAGAKSRWNVASNTTLRLNVMNNDSSGFSSGVKWTIVARRVR